MHAVHNPFSLQGWNLPIPSLVKEYKKLVRDTRKELAAHLVQGVDVWINTPRRPWEACGTSGMKVLVNGGRKTMKREIRLHE